MFGFGKKQEGTPVEMPVTKSGRIVRIIAGPFMDSRASRRARDKAARRAEGRKNHLRNVLKTQSERGKPTRPKPLMTTAQYLRNRKLQYELAMEREGIQVTAA